MSYLPNKFVYHVINLTLKVIDFKRQHIICLVRSPSSRGPFLYLYIDIRIYILIKINHISTHCIIKFLIFIKRYKPLLFLIIIIKLNNKCFLIISFYCISAKCNLKKRRKRLPVISSS